FFFGAISSSFHRTDAGCIRSPANPASPGCGRLRARRSGTQTTQVYLMLAHVDHCRSMIERQAGPIAQRNSRFRMRK
ncbi:hypothetical protein, partial [Microbacterium sp.]|uniref:hypothetical protein n=1 Tax=Microbacterium sp. TaxID=51671 RepID=UPI00356472BB